MENREQGWHESRSIWSDMHEEHLSPFLPILFILIIAVVLKGVLRSGSGGKLSYERTGRLFNSAERSDDFGLRISDCGMLKADSESICELEIWRLRKTETGKSGIHSTTLRTSSIRLRSGRVDRTSEKQHVGVMSAQEIIEQIKALSASERAQVAKFVVENDNSWIPESFQQGMADAEAGRLVDLDTALNEPYAGDQ